MTGEDNETGEEVKLKTTHKRKLATYVSKCSTVQKSRVIPFFIFCFQGAIYVVLNWSCATVFQVFWGTFKVIFNIFSLDIGCFFTLMHICSHFFSWIYEKMPNTMVWQTWNNIFVPESLFLTISQKPGISLHGVQCVLQTVWGHWKRGGQRTKWQPKKLFAGN